MTVSSQQQNPLYGTAKVLTSLSRLFSRLNFEHVPMVQKAVSWLLSVQHSNGVWGAEKSITPSIEVTALAVDALAGLIICSSENSKIDYRANLSLLKKYTHRH